jgi:hypothetical protein
MKSCSGKVWLWVADNRGGMDWLPSEFAHDRGIDADLICISIDFSTGLI